jgi:hypothetical protein
MKSPRSAQLIMHHAMMTYGRVEVELHAILTSPLDGREKSASELCRFARGGGGSQYWGWVGNRSSVDPVKRRKISQR